MKSLLRYGPALLYAAFIFWLSSQSDPPVLGPLALNDKIKHFTLYGVFTLLVWRAIVPSLRNHLIALGVGVVGVVSTYGATDEFHQRFTPGRSCDVHDWLADTFAAIVVAGLLAFLSMRSRAVQEKN